MARALAGPGEMLRRGLILLAVLIAGAPGLQGDAPDGRPAPAAVSPPSAADETGPAGGGPTAENSRPVFCPVCGARNRSGSRFCLKDGSPLPSIEPGRFERGFVRLAETYSPEEVQQAISRARQSVVRVRVETMASLKYPATHPSGFDGWLESQENEERLVGTGFAVGPPGEIVTNAHVASPFGNPARIRVDALSGRTFSARLVGVDKASDLALLKIETSSVPPLEWADSAELHLGDETWAIGFPLDIGLSVTRGTISSIGRMRAGLNQVESFLHSDAYITHGSSGGPLVDVLGRVVGVSDMGFHQAKGQGYSIPSQMARYVTERLSRSGAYERGFLGLHVRPVDAVSIRKFGLRRAAGVVVESLLERTPAAAAGFEPGDVLFGINGRQAVSTYLIQEAVSSLGPGVTLQLTLDRAGRVLEIPVTTIRRPEEPRIDPVLDLETRLMIRFEEDPKGKGVMIRIDDPFSLARKYGLRDGVRMKLVVPARDWREKHAADKPRNKVEPTVVGSLDQLREALRHSYLGGRFGVTLILGSGRNREVSVAFDETWAIII